MLQDIRGTQDVDEEFSDICDACVEANKVRTTYITFVVSQVHKQGLMCWCHQRTGVYSSSHSVKRILTGVDGLVESLHVSRAADPKTCNRLMPAGVMSAFWLRAGSESLEDHPVSEVQAAASLGCCQYLLPAMDWHQHHHLLCSPAVCEFGGWGGGSSWCHHCYWHCQPFSNLCLLPCC